MLHSTGGNNEIICQCRQLTSEAKLRFPVSKQLINNSSIFTSASESAVLQIYLGSGRAEFVGIPVFCWERRLLVRQFSDE